ncbi:MAG: hypothetical protein GX605_09830 [Chloroflexi bacterium]|nr:hypothetical protein [Chloroflexota bacterium]
MSDRESILEILGQAEEAVRQVQGQVECACKCGTSVIKLMETRALLDRAGILILNHYLDQCFSDPAEMDPQRLLRALELFFRMMPPQGPHGVGDA